MRFSIVTPSYKQPEWLRLCAASVADQAGPGIEVEHIVQDSLSGPEIVEALAPFPQVKLVSEKDSGMYDAIIRGWEKATGDILCWLNCDEQYLPGALKEVADYFRDHPGVDVLFADIIVVDAGGGYMCSRQVLVPQLYHTWTCHLQPFSCATFFRSHLLKERGLSLDPRWKDIGDAEWVVRLLRAHVRMGALRRYLSTFVDDGNNRNLRPLAQQERDILTSEAPRWVQALRLVWMLFHRLRRMWHGQYWPQPFAYDIYTQTGKDRRSHFAVPRPTFYWKTRMEKAAPRRLLSNGWQRIKLAITGFLWSHPSGYRAVEKLRYCVEGFDRSFDLLFDGFPRSGNTFGSMMILVSQKDRLKIPGTRHNPSDFIRSANAGKPTCLTLREPVDAISSWIIYNNLSIESMVHFYINFHRILLPYRSKFLVLPFYVITEDIPLVIDLVNSRFGMNLEQPFDLEACKIRALERIDNKWRNEQGIVNEFQVARPHPARERRKMELKQELLSLRYSGLLRQCEELYQIYEHEFLSRLPQENRFHDPARRQGGSGAVSAAKPPLLSGAVPCLSAKQASPVGNGGKHGLKISVVTPSYKQLPWLRLCAASVADQQGIEVEHIVQDAQSGSELEDWVRRHPAIQLHVECDSGMYDAINRGFDRATGDIVCWLNSDEQYLPGALAKVTAFFETHPEIDILFGDALLIGNTGALISYRRTIMPNFRHIQVAHLNVLSCATFVRRSVLQRGYRLNTRWKAIADAVWVSDLLQAGIPMAVMHEPLAVFTITDKNLGQTSLAFTETKHWQQETGSGNLGLRLVYIVWHRLNKLVEGAYWPRSVSASLYTLTSPEKRVTRSAASLGFQWPRSTHGMFS